MSGSYEENFPPLSGKDSDKERSSKRDSEKSQTSSFFSSINLWGKKPEKPELEKSQGSRTEEQPSSLDFPGEPDFYIDKRFHLVTKSIESDNIYVTGNCPQLGNWKTLKVKMKKKPQKGFCYWVSEYVKIDPQIDLQFKFLEVQARGMFSSATTEKWEEGNNRLGSSSMNEFCLPRWPFNGHWREKDYLRCFFLILLEESNPSLTENLGQLEDFLAQHSSCHSEFVNFLKENQKDYKENFQWFIIVLSKLFVRASAAEWIPRALFVENILKLASTENYHLVSNTVNPLVQQFIISASRDSYTWLPLLSCDHIDIPSQISVGPDAQNSLKEALRKLSAHPSLSTQTICRIFEVCAPSGLCLLQLLQFASKVEHFLSTPEAQKQVGDILQMKLLGSLNKLPLGTIAEDFQRLVEQGPTFLQEIVMGCFVQVVTKRLNDQRKKYTEEEALAFKMFLFQPSFLTQEVIELNLGPAASYPFFREYLETCLRKELAKPGELAGAVRKHLLHQMRMDKPSDHINQNPLVLFRELEEVFSLQGTKVAQEKIFKGAHQLGVSIVKRCPEATCKEWREIEPLSSRSKEVFLEGAQDFLKTSAASLPALRAIFSLLLPSPATSPLP